MGSLGGEVAEHASLSSAAARCTYPGMANLSDPKIPGIRPNADGTLTLCDDEECCPTVAELANGDYRITGDDGQFVDLTPRRAELLGFFVMTRNA